APTMSDAQRIAGELAEAESALRAQAPAARAALLGDDTAGEVLARLDDEREHTSFMGRLTSLKVPPPLGSADAFTRLVREDRPHLMTLVETIQAGHRQAIAQVRSATGGVTPRQLFAAPTPDVQAILSGAGYAIDAAAIEELTAQAVRGQQIASLTEAMTSTEVRGALARQM